MKIESSDVVLASASMASSRREVRESLRAWVGDTRPDFEGNGRVSQPESSALVSLSETGKTAQSAETQALNEIDEAVENDPRMRLIRILIEFMTGKEIRFVRAEDVAQSGSKISAPSSAPSSAAPPAERAGYGIEYDYHESYAESASMSFAASGVIRTADDKEISFNLSLQMQRSYSQETNVSIRAGDARKVDPLIINFSGSAAQLSEQKFSFDLNADGDNENIRFVQGSGFLALDRNGDGKINNGKELFGPVSGNGFAELKALDEDGNDWIDEMDAVYRQLAIWTRDNEGKDVLSSLKQSTVGALYLGNVSSPFDIKDSQNNLQAQVRASGIWLSDSGQVGSMQQIDLVA